MKKELILKPIVLMDELGADLLEMVKGGKGVSPCSVVMVPICNTKTGKCNAFNESCATFTGKCNTFYGLCDSFEGNCKIHGLGCKFSG